MAKKNKKVKEETVEDIRVFWTIMDGWENLSYEKKAEYYWKYQIVNGVRVFDRNEG